MSINTRNTRRFSTACLVVLAALTGACADANGVGPTGPEQPSYSKGSAVARSPWTASGPGTVAVVSNGTAGDAVMTYEMSGSAVWSPQEWEFETTASQAGTVTLPWAYSGFHSFFQVRVVLYAVVNGVVVGTLVNEGPANCCTSPSGGFSYSGTHAFTVQAGDTYGFRFGGQNYDWDSRLNGTFTVTMPRNPVTADACKNGGWAAYGFKNQGECVSFVQTGKDRR